MWLEVEFHGIITGFLWYTKQIFVAYFLGQNSGDPLTAHLT